MVPVLQFVVLALITTPPNFMWYVALPPSPPTKFGIPPQRTLYSPDRRQEYLEQAFPATASKKRPRGAKPLAPRLNIRNTATKALLDQTAGAAVNTLLFTLAINSLAQAMTPLQSETELLSLRLAGRSLAFLTSGGAFDAARVDWDKVVSQSAADFWPILMSGWSFWPFVSLVNFAFVRDVGRRNLVGGVAGVAWGMYMSGFAAR